MKITTKIVLAMAAAMLLGASSVSLVHAIKAGNEDGIVLFGMSTLFALCSVFLRGNVALVDSSDMELMLRFTGYRPKQENSNESEV